MLHRVGGHATHSSISVAGTSGTSRVYANTPVQPLKKLCWIRCGRNRFKIMPNLGT